MRERFRVADDSAARACAGVTVVWVLPTHRRKGLLRRMMEVQLRDIRSAASRWRRGGGVVGFRRGDLSTLRYGLATISLILDIEQTSVDIRSDLLVRETLRFVDVAEATKVFSKLYERVARVTSGFTSRRRVCGS